MTEFIAPGTRFHALSSPFRMRRGESLDSARIAYETWGQLNESRDNAILILTGLSPNAHAASNPGNPDPGWWEEMLYLSFSSLMDNFVVMITCNKEICSSDAIYNIGKLVAGRLK